MLGEMCNEISPNQHNQSNFRWDFLCLFINQTNNKLAFSKYINNYYVLFVSNIEQFVCCFHVACNFRDKSTNSHRMQKSIDALVSCWRKVKYQKPMMNCAHMMQWYLLKKNWWFGSQDNHTIWKIMNDDTFYEYEWLHG